MFEAPLTFTEAMIRRNMPLGWKARYGWAWWPVAAREREKI
jgi:hypothetical protein